MIYEGNIKGVISKRWNIRARTYDKAPGHGIHSNEEKQAWLRILADALDNKTKLKILDVGTGTGALALLLAEAGHDVSGIDLSDQMLIKAREKAAANNLKVDFRVGDAENPPFPGESFDAIVSRHVLWTLPNPEHAVKTWHSLLKPKGRVVIIDGNWGQNSRTGLQEFWRIMAMPLILITEFRDPRMPNKDIDKHLPMKQKKRPEADIELLTSMGFEAGVTDVELPRHYSILDYLKYGHSQHSKYQFVVKGIKAANNS